MEQEPTQKVDARMASFEMKKLALELAVDVHRQGSANAYVPPSAAAVANTAQAFCRFLWGEWGDEGDSSSRIEATEIQIGELLHKQQRTNGSKMSPTALEDYFLGKRSMDRSTAESSS